MIREFLDNFFFNPQVKKCLSAQLSANWDIPKAISVEKSFRATENVGTPSKQQTVSKELENWKPCADWLL